MLFEETPEILDCNAHVPAWQLDGREFAVLDPPSYGAATDHAVVGDAFYSDVRLAV